MTNFEILTTIISFSALAVSLLAAYKAYGLGEYQMRLNTRIEFQTWLIEIDKFLVEKPELWAIYDSHEMSRHRSESLEERAKLEAFGFMTLNIFEGVFAFYGDSPRLTSFEKDSFRAWKAYLRDTLQDSSLLRSLVGKKSTRKMYNAKFIAEVDSILGQGEKRKKKSKET